MMERLTKRNSVGTIGVNELRYYNYNNFQKIVQKLAEYEDLEEQGLLLRLPFKGGGDIVYAIGFNNNKPIIYESVVLSILITEKEIVFNVKVDEFETNSQLNQSMFGKTVFLTQAEAEQKLNEMNTDNGITE